MNGTKKVAVVSGASAGIGKAAARALLQQGWRVIGVGRDPERCAAAAAELSALPDAIEARNSAVAGAMTIISAQRANSMCPMAASASSSHKSLRTGRPDTA